MNICSAVGRDGGDLRTVGRFRGCRARGSVALLGAVDSFPDEEWAVERELSAPGWAPRHWKVPADTSRALSPRR